MVKGELDVRLRLHRLCILDACLTTGECHLEGQSAPLADSWPQLYQVCVLFREVRDLRQRSVLCQVHPLVQADFWLRRTQGAPAPTSL